jgi:hypothetical protein
VIGGGRRCFGRSASRRQTTGRAAGGRPRSGRRGSASFTTGCFDLVVSAFTHPDVKDFTSLAQDVRRVLEPGGRFLYVGLHPCFKGPFAEQPRNDGARVVYPRLPAAAALRRHVADSPDRETARPLTTLGGVGPAKVQRAKALRGTPMRRRDQQEHGRDAPPPGRAPLHVRYACSTSPSRQYVSTPSRHRAGSACPSACTMTTVQSHPSPAASRRRRCPLGTPRHGTRPREALFVTFSQSLVAILLAGALSRR